MSHILTFLLLFIINSSFSQETEIKVYNFDTIMESLETNGKNSDYYKDLDYDAMLYLDNSSNGLLKKIKPEYTHLPENLEPDFTIQQTPINIQSVSSLITGNDLLKRLISNFENEVEFVIQSIYYKNPDKIYLILDGGKKSDWLNSYGIKIENKMAKLQFFIKTIE